VAAALALAAGVYVLFFTTFFTHWPGLVDSLRGLLLWTRRGAGGDGHEKPWFYFLKLLGEFETVTAFCALGGAWLAFRRRDGFGILCCFWAAGQLVLYSAIPYKTPWLVLNILVPATLAAGVFCRELAGSSEISRWWRPALRAALAAVGALAALGLVWMGWRTVETSFLRYDDDRLTIVYVPTLREVRGLVSDIEATVARVPGGRRPKVRIFLPYSWPLPWYFRDMEGVGVWTEVQKNWTDGDVILVEGSQDATLRPLMKERYVRREVSIRPRTPVVVYVDGRLTPPPSAP
jgi:predicted membrane-bound mannosyltransferase